MPNNVIKSNKSKEFYNFSVTQQEKLNINFHGIKKKCKEKMESRKERNLNLFNHTQKTVLIIIKFK